jgi:tetraacyldisaccharide 4'-kinase
MVLQAVVAHDQLRSGVALPQGARGIAPERCIALPDHYDFDGWMRPSGGPYSLVCTEKDAVKLWRIAPDALAIELVFAPEEAFFAALDAKLSSLDGHQAA